VFVVNRGFEGYERIIGQFDLQGLRQQQRNLRGFVQRLERHKVHGIRKVRLLELTCRQLQ
jgi:hypothetical protein